jgi:hypothetical protein
MCWNENISLNTFIFSSLVLIFIWYNNSYTQYLVKEFDHWSVYLFFFSYSSMQLIEYFLWKSIKAKDLVKNKIFSIIGWILIRVIQPLAIILTIPSNYLTLRNLAFIIYFSLLVIVSIYKQLYNPIEFITKVDKNTHLRWMWMELRKYEKILGYLYLTLSTALAIRLPVLTLFAFIIWFYCLFNHYMTWSSNWCWLLNSVLLFFLIKILFILPYKEYNKLC